MHKVFTFDDIIMDSMTSFKMSEEFHPNSMALGSDYYGHKSDGLWNILRFFLCVMGGKIPNQLTVKQLGILFQNVILFSNKVPNNCTTFI